MKATLTTGKEGSMRPKRGILIFTALTAAGFLACGLGRGQANDKMDPESEKFYKEARLIMSSQESKIFKLLPDAEARKEFIQDFWDKRNPEPGSDTNAFKIEYESRVEYANRHFKEGGLGMDTTRGRVYIFLGPPDKNEEFFNQNTSATVKGSVIWWIYYKYGVGVEFVDEKGYGTFKINKTEGDLFEAMDLYKLGQWVGPDSVFKKRVVNFNLKYDGPGKKLVVLIPAKFLLFKETSDGKLQVDLDFKFYIYENEGAKRDITTGSQSFLTTVQDLEKMKDVLFEFAYALKPGKNFVDVIIRGGAGSKGKVRKIFDIKVGR